MKKAKGKKGKGHTGRIRHHDMASLIDGHGKKDPHASAEHHAANSAHGMPVGLVHKGEDDDSGVEGGGGMSENAEYC